MKEFYLKNSKKQKLLVNLNIKSKSVFVLFSGMFGDSKRKYIIKNKICSESLQKRLKTNYY